MLMFHHLLCNRVSGVDRNRMNPHADPCGTPYLTWMHSNTGLHRELQQERQSLITAMSVRHRYRNALHLRQTKYVWHSMEAVVNKKDPKDKQALELFQYKSSLRFCVPSYIFSFNGRCGPRGVTYSSQRPLLQKDRELSLQHVFAWECEPYWFSAAYGGSRKEACCLCLSGLD